MKKEKKTEIDTVRASRAGHTFHERWAARRALQLVFPKDNLFSIVVEGLSPPEDLKVSKDAEDIADLILFYGEGETFETCTTQQTLQFKYKVATDPVTSSYLKKTIEKFSVTFEDYRDATSIEEVTKKLTFGFVTNAEFSEELWEAIASLKYGDVPKTQSGKTQRQYLSSWCKSKGVKAEEIFPLIEFRAGTSDLPSQNRELRKTISDWSANSAGQAAKRLYALVELVREKAQIEGQNRNSIKREDILDALECDEDQLFPADTQFVDVGQVIERSALQSVRLALESNETPVFLHAGGGVGKTVFIQSLAAHMNDDFEVVVFDCFGGGAYRSEAQARHLPKIGLLQIINELASRGLCDPLLPTDSDQYGLIEVCRKRFKQASHSVQSQSSNRGVLIILDAADNAQLEADVRGEPAFPRLLLASLSQEPIDGVKLLLTARPERMDRVICNSHVTRAELSTFTREETRLFLETRQNGLKEADLSTAYARSRGNARVLEYLVESWDVNVSQQNSQSEISAEELIKQKCDKIIRDLHTVGWNDLEAREFFAALSLLPPPIPLSELAEALAWSNSQVNSAASDLAPMLELVKHGAIFRDEPTETYIKDRFASEQNAQQSIAQRLTSRQSQSMYAAESLPFFLVVIGDSDRAQELADSDIYPEIIESDYGRRRLKLTRLNAAFSLAVRENDFDRALSLSFQLAESASANAKGDEFIRESTALAILLGDSDVSRRLFNDRSGWRGARDARLAIAYCFSEELDEARIYQRRAIGWLNWYLNNTEEMDTRDTPRVQPIDVASVLFLNVIDNNFVSFDHNLALWSSEFAMKIVKELIELCVQHETGLGAHALHNLARFAADKDCKSNTLKIGLLSGAYGISAATLRSISLSASSSVPKHLKHSKNHHAISDHDLTSFSASAAMTSLIVNSKQSAKRLTKLCARHRPTGYDYSDRFNGGRIWTAIKAECAFAWSSSKKLSLQALMPQEIKLNKVTKTIHTKSDLRAYLDGLTVTRQNRDKQTETSKRYSNRESKDIADGIFLVLELIKPLETAVLSRSSITSDMVAAFLEVWKLSLRPDIHWNSETGRDTLARRVGLGLVNILLQHSQTIEKSVASELITILNANRFHLGDKLGILSLLARRAQLSEMCGAYAEVLCGDIVKDEYVEQRSGSFRELAHALMPMSFNEAQHYYTIGLSQLDKMGANDHELIYSILQFAEEQRGGFIKPELSHRLMNLCHAIFNSEASKFGWTLFGQAAATTIGFTAIYKLLRWNDQEIANYSYGLPQMVCFLTKAGRLDARRAAVILAVCEEHGWHDWRIGEGLQEILKASSPEERKPIFQLVLNKLSQEHAFGGWESLWSSIIECVEAFEEITEKTLLDQIRLQREITRDQRRIENSRSNGSPATIHREFELRKKKEAQDRDETITALLSAFDFTSASAVDRAIQSVQAIEGLVFNNTQSLMQRLRENCPYAQRLQFLEAVCQSTELEFDRTLDFLIEALKVWAGSSASLRRKSRELIKTLFAFKGSNLFDHLYSRLSGQLYRLSEFCGDEKFILELVLSSIVKERLELNGDEWLQLSTSLSKHAKPTTSLNALERFLAGATANIGDEIGEGGYRSAFAGKSNEQEVLSDVIWHLLGDSDAFTRWNAARAIKGIVELGLIGDIECLLDSFDTIENPSLKSDDHHFAYLNAQQWFLMGLSRAALHHGDKLLPIKSRLLALANRPNLHALNKLHVARCLRNIEGDEDASPELTKLWDDVRKPPHGIVEHNGFPAHKESQIEFSFGYEFGKYKIAELARLFWISENEARDFMAKEILKTWPDAQGISDLPGDVRYQPDERYETYPEHVQKHARLHAATALVQNNPVSRASYEWWNHDPWMEFFKSEDTSFPDGSWLSDHKDKVPPQAYGYLLGERDGNQDTLIHGDTLFKKLGFAAIEDDGYFLLYGNWKSPDGVNVRVNSALVQERGAVKKCTQFAKAKDHDIWLPQFDSEGHVDRHIRESLFKPLIHQPEKYPIGIDERDKWATPGAIARPRLGLIFNKKFGLKSDVYEKSWHTSNDLIALKNQVWGEWRYDEGVQNSMYQDDGTTLWADNEWLDHTLASCKQSIVLTINVSRYRSSRSYDGSRNLRAVYVGLKRRNEQPRFWYAKLASQTTY